MYARSTTVHGNPQSLDDAIAYLRDEVMPAVQEMDGCIGMSMMCDRDSGRCIATTAWETEEAMHNSESGMHDMRQRYAEMLGGTPEVQEWEIALLHRLHHAPDGACCRVLWSRGNPDDVGAGDRRRPHDHAVAHGGPARLLQRQHADRPRERTRRDGGGLREPARRWTARSSRPSRCARSSRG